MRKHTAFKVSQEVNQPIKLSRLLQFNPKTFNNDIALVELTSPVVLSDHVTPVCLPSAIEPPTGSPCLVAGWGSLYEGEGLFVYVYI